jgi:hypothetical protein
MASTRAEGDESTNWNISEKMASLRVGVNADVISLRSREGNVCDLPRGKPRSLMVSDWANRWIEPFWW